MNVWTRRALALVVTGGLLAALVPACTIHLRPADRDEIEDESAENEPTERPDEDSQTGGSETSVDGETLSPEEHAYDELLNVDPHELALKTMATSYAAVMVASLVESQVLDPAAVDEAAVESLIEQFEPAGWDAAYAWMET